MIYSLLKRPMFQLIFIAVLGFSINYLFNVLLSRQLSPAIYGDLSFAMKLITLVATVFMFGKNQAIINIVSQHHIDDNTIEEKHFMRWCMKSSLKSIALLLLGCLILIVLSLLLKSINYFHLEKVHISIWILPAASLFTLLQIILPFYSVNGRAILQETIFVDLYPTLFVIILFCITLIVTTFKPYHGLMVYYLGLAILLLLTILIFFSQVRSKKSLDLHLNTSEINPQSIKEWQKKSHLYFKGSLNYAVLCLIGYLIVETSTLIPGSAISESSVGFYAAICAIKTIIFVIDISIYNALIPRIKELYRTQEKRATLESLTLRSSSVSICCASAISLIIIVFGKPLLALFGPSYTSAYVPLVIYCLCDFLYTCCGMMPSLLSYLNHQTIKNRIELASCILYLLLGYTLSYYLGLLGLSITAATVWGTRSLLYYVFCRKKLTIKPLGFI